jgi:recombination protein RecA
MPPKLSPLAAHAAAMEKKYGHRAVTTTLAPRSFIPTGSLGVDHILRTGGWPVGLICEILGPPDVGKSTLVISSMIQALKMFPERGVCYIDMEGTFDYDWATSLGLACSEEDIASGRWLHLYPENSEEASDMVRDQTGTGLYSMVVMDSVGGMESKKALDKEAEKDSVGKNAQVITRMVKHLGTLARIRNASVLLVNQPRANINAMAVSDISAGPKALQHQTGMKIQMSRGGEMPRTMVFEQGQPAEPVAVQVKAKLVRSKITAPGRVCEYWICNRHTETYGPPGIYVADECVDIGIRTGAIKQAGAWYTFPAGLRVHSRDECYAAIRKLPELVEQVRGAMFAEVS